MAPSPGPSPGGPSPVVFPCPYVIFVPAPADTQYTMQQAPQWPMQGGDYAPVGDFVPAGNFTMGGDFAVAYNCAAPGGDFAATGGCVPGKFAVPAAPCIYPSPDCGHFWQGTMPQGGLAPVNGVSWAPIAMAQELSQVGAGMEDRQQQQPGDKGQLQQQQYSTPPPRRQELTPPQSAPKHSPPAVLHERTSFGSADDKHAPMSLLAEARQAAMEGRSGKVWELACMGKDTSYAVQEALGIVANTLLEAKTQQDWGMHELAIFDARALLADLHGHVVEAVKHPHANHVVKQAVQVMPTEFVGFIACELKETGHAVWAASHCYGCRSVLRLVRHCGGPRQPEGGGDRGWAGACVDELVGELLKKAAELCRDEFGKYVLEEFIKHGLADHRNTVVDALRSRMLRNAKHRHASTLIRKAFHQCDAEMAERMVGDLLSGSRESILSLLKNQFSIYLLQDLALPGQHREKLREKLVPFAAEMQNSKQGRKLWELLWNSRG